MRRLAVVLLAMAACGAPAELAVRTEVTAAPDRTRLAVEGTSVPTTTTIPPRLVGSPRAGRSSHGPRIGPPPTARAVAPIAPVGEIQQAICDAFGSACGQALRVAKCESGFNPRATNGSHRGLFQISIKWHAARIQRMGYTLDQMWEVGPNIAVALAIYLEQGWGPWECKA